MTITTQRGPRGIALPVLLAALVGLGTFFVTLQLPMAADTFSLGFAVGLVVGQGLAVLGLLRFVKSFGAFTSSNHDAAKLNAAVSETNQLLYQHAMQVLDEVKQIRQSTREVA